MYKETFLQSILNPAPKTYQQIIHNLCELITKLEEIFLLLKVISQSELNLKSICIKYTTQS